MDAGNELGDMDVEWEKRVLCSDESCIGTIGPDGRCRECGLPYEGTLPGVSEQDQVDEAAAIGGLQADAGADSQGQASNEAPADQDAADKGQSASADDEWERRTLCPDESCIGVIGPDGRCKECGKSI